MSESMSDRSGSAAVVVSAHQIVKRLEQWIGSELQNPSWDSYGARPVTTETIQLAMKLAWLIVGRIDKVNTIQPCPDGSIEFSDPDGSICIRVSLTEDGAATQGL